jgi:hypothetical protein
MSDDFKITVNSSRQFQRELDESISHNYPKIKPNLTIRKSLDAFQTTTLVISGSILLINIIRLILDLRKGHSDTEIEIELKSDNRSKSLKIMTNQSIDTEKVVEGFLNDEER